MKLGTLLRINDISEANTKFAELAEMGFPSCQLVYKPKTYIKEDALKIVELSKKYNVEISSQFCGFHNPKADKYEKMNYWKSAAEFMSQMGITDMVIHAGEIPINTADYLYEDIKEKIFVLASYCKGLGLNVLFETGLELPISLLRIIEEDVATGNLYVNLDTANIITSGYGNPVDSLYVYGKYVRNIHAKDGLAPTAKSRGKETAIGEGLVDFPKFISVLKEQNYDRYITIEREITGEKQKEDILNAKIYLESLWNS